MLCLNVVDKMVYFLKQVIFLLYLLFLIKIIKAEVKKYQKTQIESFRVLYETSWHNSELQCCTYCSQIGMCEGVEFTDNSCKTLIDITISKNGEKQAWIESQYLKQYELQNGDSGFLIIGGFLNTDDFGKDETEFVDFHSQTSYKTNLKFKDGLALTGKISQTEALACDKFWKCYLLTFENDSTFTKLPFQVQRWGAQALSFDGFLWLTGADKNNAEFRQDTSIIVTKTEKVSGPNLPYKMMSHCMLKIGQVSPPWFSFCKFVARGTNCVF